MFMVSLVYIAHAARFFKYLLYPVRIRITDFTGPEPVSSPILMNDILIIDMQPDPIVTGHLLRKRVGMILLHLLQVARHVDNLIKPDPVLAKERFDISL